MESGEFCRALGRQSPEDFTLRVVGKEEYFLAQKPISCYKVIILKLKVFLL